MNDYDDHGSAVARTEQAIETEAVYHELFDHDNYGALVGDGMAEDSYSDQLWATAETIARERLAERGVLPPGRDDDLPSVEEQQEIADAHRPGCRDLPGETADDTAVCPASSPDPRVRALTDARDDEPLDCVIAAGHRDDGQHLGGTGVAWVDPSAERDADRGGRAPLDDIRAAYDALFDHEYHAGIVGDGAREDAYIDSVWEHATAVVIGTASSLATHEQGAPDQRFSADDDELDEGDHTRAMLGELRCPEPPAVIDASAAQVLDDWDNASTLATTPPRDRAGQHHVNRQEKPGRAVTATEPHLADVNETRTHPETPGETVWVLDTPGPGEGAVDPWVVAQVSEDVWGAGAAGRPAGEWAGEPGGESPGEPGAAEAVAGAHAAVLASAQTPRHDSPSATASDPVVEHQDHTQDAGDGR